MDWFGTPLTPLAGGYSGETFLVGEAGDEVVLRIYDRDPARASVDASLLRLVRGILPVPRVLEERPPADGNPGVLVTERLRGQRLDIGWPAADAAQRVAVGHQLGHLLGRLSGIPMLRFGMLTGSELAISSDGPPAEDLTAWARHFRDVGRLSTWSVADWDGLVELTELAEDLTSAAGDSAGVVDGAAAVAPHPGRVVLVHSDFNPKNLLVDPDTLRVTGLLDWEFAHAGSPYTDLGNLTRFERHADFVDAVLETFVRGAPPLGADPLLLGRCSDLWALVELAGRDKSNAVCELASQLLLAQARTGDLAAWPWEAARVDPSVAGHVS